MKHNLIADVVMTGAPNVNFRKNICSEDDLRSRIFGTVVVKFLACLLLVGFENPFLTAFFRKKEYVK